MPDLAGGHREQMPTRRSTAYLVRPSDGARYDRQRRASSAATASTRTWPQISGVLALAAIATACVQHGSTRCRLEHIPDGMHGQLGRTMNMSWGHLETPWQLTWVELNGFTHATGVLSVGSTAHVEVTEDGLLLVTIQDVMRLEGGPRHPRVRRRPRGERGPDLVAEAPQSTLAGRTAPRGPGCTPPTSYTASEARRRAREAKPGPLTRTRHTANPQVIAMIRTAGIAGPQARPRGLRHSYGVAAVTAGVPLPTIAAVLGHTSLTTTAIYTTAIGAEARELVSRV